MKKWIGALLTLIIVGVIIAISVLPAGAADEPDVSIPKVINYQGYLTDDLGNPINGTVAITFSIYDVPSGGSALWTETQSSVSVSKGLFNVQLGNATSFDSDDFAGTSYLAVQVNKDAEMTPRQLLTSVAYALFSNEANNANTLDGMDSDEFADTHSLNAADGSPVNALYIDNHGNVGIGTTNPSQKLTVSGMIESTSNGFKFPDGSIQATAAQSNARGRVMALANLMDRFEYGVDFPSNIVDALDCNSGVPNTTSLSFTIEGSPMGQVIGLMGEDKISQTYAYFIAFESEKPDLPLEFYLGKPAELLYNRSSYTSVFQGVITEMGLAAYDGNSATYVVRVEPDIATLQWTSGYKIFQEKNVPDIVSEIVIDHCGPGYHQNLISGSYDPVCFEMMYEESPLSFASRLMEREGMHFHFESGVSGESMVIGDSNAAFASPPSSLTYYGHLVNPGTDEEFVSSFHHKSSLFTGASSVSSYDFENPAFDISASVSDASGTGEKYSYAPELTNTVPDPNGRAQINQEREASRKNQYIGTSNAASLKAGHVFTLTDVNGVGLDGIYLVTDIRHMALYDEVADCYTYCNAFSAIPSSATYRPDLITPTPQVSGLVTAVVTGPTGETQYTDEYGRIKAHFRWDRSGSMDDTSSAWIRVSVPGGKLNEQYFVPEIGTEVLVGFIQGNPSLPVVIGSLFNSDYLPPVPENCTIYISPEGDVIISSPRDVTIDATQDYSVTSGNDMTIHSDMNMTIEAGLFVDLLASADIDIEVGGNMEIKSQGVMDLLSALIKLNGGGSGAAREGDPVSGGTIDSGSNTVEIGN